MPDLDNENTITTPSGETIVLSRAAPRSLESYHGLLVQALLDLLDGFTEAANEACAGRERAEDKKGRDEGGAYDHLSVLFGQLDLSSVDNRPGYGPQYSENGKTYYGSPPSGGG